MKLTQLARKTIESHFKNKKFEPDKLTIKKYNDVGCCFVTLAKNGNLRGCIGSLEPQQELWKDVMDNSLNAAFNDPRFAPLDKDELNDIKIEVSVLSKSEKLGKGEEVLNQLKKDMGIILKKGFFTSTFLPQVWEQIPDKKEFLEHLSMKAGLPKDAWKNSELWCYQVNIEEE